MELFTKHKGKEIWLHNYRKDGDLNIDFNNSPFVCMVWNNRENFVSPVLIEQLLKANCKYIVVGGKNCEKWHDYADEIHISLYSDFQVPDSEHVMTTWHDNEPLEEVIWFTLNNTNFDSYEFNKFLFIQIDTKFSQDEIQKIIDKQWYWKESP